MAAVAADDAGTTADGACVVKNAEAREGPTARRIPADEMKRSICFVDTMNSLSIDTNYYLRSCCGCGQIQINNSQKVMLVDDARTKGLLILPAQ